MKKNDYLLEIIVFISGAVVMVFELVGSRVLAPYLGTSIFVWTSLIGVILGSLSLGYFIGGSLADKRPEQKILTVILLLAALFIGLTALSKDFALNFLQTKILDIRWGSLIATLLLFAPASVFLGMVLPFCVRLKLKDLKKSGTTVGVLYAISTIGSISGTFGAGFFFIPFFGITRILLLLSIVLALTTFISYGFGLLKAKIIIIVLLVSGLIVEPKLGAHQDKLNFKAFDSAYNHIWVYDQPSKYGNVRHMRIGNKHTSAMFVDNDQLAFVYTRFYRLARHFNPYIKKALMIGGGAYSYPKDFLYHYPHAMMDVVEIDPKITELAELYFRLPHSPRLNVIHEDGRIFLNQTRNKYDAIYIDAFKSLHSIPYQLTTLESITKEYQLLNENGVVLANIISSLNGDFLRAEVKTYQQRFAQVLIIPVQNFPDPDAIQNILLVALKKKQSIRLTDPDPELNQYINNLYSKKLKTDLPVLTDAYAPVEYYTNKLNYYRSKTAKAGPS